MGDPVIDPNTYPVNNRPIELATLSDPKYLWMVVLQTIMVSQCTLSVALEVTYFAKTGGIVAVSDPENPPKMTATRKRVHQPVAQIQKRVAKNIAKTANRSIMMCPTLSPAPPRTTLPKQFAMPIEDIKKAASMLLLPMSIANGTR